MSQLSLWFIVNPISGGKTKEQILKTIKRHVDSQKYDVEVYITSYPKHATELAQKAVEKKIDVVVAVGGDGTINEVAKALLYSNTALGIIPCGSGDGLARHLHIPRNVKKAIQIVNDGYIESVDSISVNDMPCFCTAGVGYDAHVCEKYSKASKRGLITYIRKAIEEWRKYEPLDYELITEHASFKRKALAIICANINQWGNGFHVAPRASIKDKLMDVVIIRPFKLQHLIPMLFQILGTSFYNNSYVGTLETSCILIKRQKPGVVHIDGEPFFLDEEIRIKIKNNSLKVLVNKMHKHI